MKNSILLVLFITCFTGQGLLRADEVAKQPTAEDRTYTLFQQYMQARDWHMAEVVARGALGKFGSEHEVTLRMRMQLVRLCEGNLNVAHRFDFLPHPPAPPKILNQVYMVDDILKPENKSYSKPLEKLATELLELRGDLAKEAIAVCPFYSNISLVVSTTKEHHARIEECLKSKREQK